MYCQEADLPVRKLLRVGCRLRYWGQVLAGFGVAVAAAAVVAVVGDDHGDDDQELAEEAERGLVAGTLAAS